MTAHAAAAEAALSPRESVGRSPFAWQPFDTGLLVHTTDLSSDRSSQERMACLMSHGSHEGSRTHSMGAPSSHGSIGAAGKVDSPENSPSSMARSGLSLAQAADKAAAGGEDADVSSMQLRPRLRGGSSARHLGSSSTAGCASALELPAIEGSTAGEKAANALRMADAAMADARQKAKRAAELVAAAQQAGAREAQRAKRRRRQVLRAYAGPPSHVLLGARISVFWPDDQAFYKGRIVEVREEGEGVRCVYDDEMEEWLALPRERFQWLAPRAQSAGGGAALQAEMARMGAVGVSQAPRAPDAAAAPLQGEARAPLGSEAVGGRVAIHFTGVGVWCSGEVIAYDDVREMHHVLYEDGEHEWVCLRKEAHCWAPPQPGPAYPAGLPPGMDVPTGGKVVGWRLGVYWPESAAFCEGEVLGYDNISGRHHMLYDSREQEHVALDSVKVRWVMPPSVSSHGQTPDAGSPARGPLGQPPAAAAQLDGTPDSSRPLRRSSAAAAAAAAGTKRHLFALRKGAPLSRCGPQAQQQQPLAWLKEEPLRPLAGPDAQLLGFEDGCMEGLAAELCCGSEEFGTEGAMPPPPPWWQQGQAPSVPVPMHARGGGDGGAAGAWAPMLPGPGSPGGSGGLPTTPQHAGELSGARASSHLEELIGELDAAQEEALVGSDRVGDDVAGDLSVPISAGMRLESLDLGLPSLPGLGADALKGLLLEGLQPMPAVVQPAAVTAAADVSSALAASTAVVLGSSEHGSNAAESLLQRTQSAATAAAEEDAAKAAALGEDAAAEADITQFFCAATEDAPPPEGQQLQQRAALAGAQLSSLLAGEGSGAAAAAPHQQQQQLGQSLMLGCPRLSIRSMASDSTALDLSSRHNSLCARALLAPVAGALTPQSGRALPEWDLASMRASLAPRDLDPEAGPSDGLGMSNELQTLIADMDWA